MFRRMALTVHLLSTCALLAVTSGAAIAQLPAELPLEDLLEGDGSEGLVIGGSQRSEMAGINGAVVGGGDINGDGIGDFVVGSRFANFSALGTTGLVYVVFGRSEPFPTSFRLGDLLPANGGDGSQGFVIVSPNEQGGNLGAEVSLGDVNGDGLLDVVTSGPNHALSEGRVYVVYGKNTAVEGDYRALFRTDRLLQVGGGDGTEGFVLRGSPAIELEANDTVGVAISAGGDLNGDGIDDIAVVSNRVLASPYLYVVYGRPGTTFPAEFELRTLLPRAGGDGSEGFVANQGPDLRISSVEDLGDISLGGDFNGDGIEDLILGYGRESIRGLPEAGTVIVLFGRGADDPFPPQFGLPSLRLTNGERGFEVWGAADTNLGSRVASAGDVDGDGVDDLLLGAVSADPDGLNSAGEAYLIFGRDVATEGNFPRILPRERIDRVRSVVFTGFNEVQNFGEVNGAGDINLDGFDDLLIGQLSGGTSTFLIYGGQPFDPVFPLADLRPGSGADGTRGVVFTSECPGGFCTDSGAGVAAVSDANGDGLPDLLLAAPGLTLGQGSDIGVGGAWLIYGVGDGTQASEGLK